MKEEDSRVLLARLDERQQAMDDKLDSILAQCIKTNGRVDRHDDDMKLLFNWKSEVRGGWKATTAISAIVGAAAAYIGNKLFGS